jgi:hypothetical protein
MSNKSPELEKVEKVLEHHYQLQQEFEECKQAKTEEQSSLLKMIIEKSLDFLIF